MIPWVVRHITFPFHQWKTGRQTLHWYHLLRQSQRWESEQLLNWQSEKLKDLLIHAAKNVPYYSDRFRAHPIDVYGGDIKTQWAAVPLLSKEIAREELDRLQARDRTRSYVKVETSGSTGLPISWHIDVRAQDVHNGVKLRHRDWWKLRLGDRQVWLWGDDELKGKGKTLRDLLVYNKKVLRLLDLSEETVSKYYANLARWKPAYLYGYPSGYMQLADLCRLKNLFLGSLGIKAVISTAEILTPSQQGHLEKTFGCPVVNEYGCAELQVIAFECPQGGMHINADTLLVEILDDRGKPIEPGQPGEIVVTDLFNSAMPLIRYRTGDVGTFKKGTCVCGRSLPLMELSIGRQVDMIRLPGGRLVHPEVFTPPHNNPFFKPLSEHVKSFQVIQETPISFRIQVVAEDQHLEMIRDRFIELVEFYLGKGFRIRVERVSEILREPSGKLRYFISNVGANGGEEAGEKP